MRVKRELPVCNSCVHHVEVKPERHHAATTANLDPVERLRSIGWQRLLPGAGGLLGSTVSGPVLGALGGPVDVAGLGGEVGSNGEGNVSLNLGVVGGGFCGLLGSLGGSGGLLGLTLNLLRVTVEEHVGHDRKVTALDAKDGAAEEPPEETNRVTATNVTGDGNVDELEGRVRVGERDARDVDVRGLTNGLVVDTGVGDNDHTGLLEGTGDVVGEGAGGESASDGSSTGLGGELEDGTLTVLATRDDTDVGRVLDGSKDTGSEDDLLPGLADVEKVDTVRTTLVDVRSHLLVGVLGADVSLGGEEEGDVLLGGVESSRDLGHFGEDETDKGKGNLETFACKEKRRKI